VPPGKPALQSSAAGSPLPGPTTPGATSGCGTSRRSANLNAKGAADWGGALSPHLFLQFFADRRGERQAPVGLAAAFQTSGDVGGEVIEYAAGHFSLARPESTAVRIRDPVQPAGEVVDVVEGGPATHQ
jgi:hypothetical protein